MHTQTFAKHLCLTVRSLGVARKRLAAQRSRKPAGVQAADQVPSMQRFRVFLLPFMALVCALPANGAPTSQEAALQFVVRHRIGSNLSTVALATATRTQTYSMVSSKLGASEARALVQREIEALLPSYQEKWNQNLAASYAEHFSAEELLSLASEGRNSKYASKLGERQGAVGVDMRSKS